MSRENGTAGYSIPVEKLAVLNWLGQVGTDGVDERLGSLVSGGVTVVAERAATGYVTPQTAGVQFDDDDWVGARIQLPGRPAGQMLVLFSPASANRATALMLGDAVEDLSTVSMEMARDALLELCSMIASGFLDEWADLVEAEIDVSTPRFLSNTEREIMRYLVTNHDDVGLYITARLRLPDHDVSATLYLFPEQEGFVDAVSRIDAEVMRQ